MNGSSLIQGKIYSSKDFIIIRQVTEEGIELSFLTNIIYFSYLLLWICLLIEREKNQVLNLQLSHYYVLIQC